MIRRFFCFQYTGSWSSSSAFLHRDFPWVRCELIWLLRKYKKREGIEIKNPIICLGCGELFVFLEPEQFEASFDIPLFS